MFKDQVVSAKGYQDYGKVSLVTSTKDADKALVIDVSNITYRAAFACQHMSTKAGTPSGHVYGFFQAFFAVLQELGPGRYLSVFCYDGRGARKARQEILPHYKATREKRDWSPLPDVVAITKKLPGIHIEEEGKEGDDAMAFAAQKLPGNKVIWSGDKDTWALLRDDVEIYSPNLQRLVTAQDIEREFGLQEPTKIRLWKAVFGDSSDNIKGLERLIKKQVIPHLAKCEGVYDLVGMVQDDKACSAKTKAKLIVGHEIVARNLEVIMPRLDFKRESVQKVGTEAKQEVFDTVVTKFECASLKDRLEVCFGQDLLVEV